MFLLLFLQPPPIPASLKTKAKQEEEISPFPLPSKEAIIDYLISFIDSEVTAWCEQVDVADLCVHNHKQLLEFKVNFLVLLFEKYPSYSSLISE